MMNPLSVLLIEDNPADADLTREAFESNRQDVDLSVVLDGVDALDFLHQREGFSDAAEPDLVLLDLNLPRKDGREVLAEIKRSDRLRQIPVVVLSSSRDG
ncbi:MAG TPA: response regulator, partial [Alphaproteobacteria bacterium]|nr:response regulator [Alphaproteobacteria bacterium]